MSKTKGIRTLAATLLLALFLTNAALAEKVLVMKDTAAYSAADTSKSLGTLEAGTLLELEAVKSGWAKVSKGGKAGIVSADDLALVKAYKGNKVYLTEDASLLKNFSSSSSLMRLKAGDAVKLYATAGEWAYVKAGSKSGYVATASLSAEKPSYDDDDYGIAAYAIADDTKVYKSNAASSKVIGKLPVNTEVTVVAAKGSWCRVTLAGKTGYMKKATLSTEKVDVVVKKTITCYVREDGVKAFQKTTTTSDVLATLSRNDEVTVTAYNDIWARVEAGKQVGYIKKDKLSVSKVEEPAPAPEKVAKGDGSATPAKGTAVEMDWWNSDIRSIFSVGTVATVTDVETGIAWYEKRFGGTNHADTQPVSATDTAAMKTAVGGTWSWQRRAVFVTINGVNYAASMNCMPHGSDSVPNNDFNGHHCIHFTNSRTHGGNKVCPLHQAAIKKAAKAKL